MKMTSSQMARLAGVGVETARFCHRAGEIIGSERARPPLMGETQPLGSIG